MSTMTAAAAVPLQTCPSAECQDWTYPDGWFTQTHAEGTGPRPVEVVIHTREGLRECQHLADLMADPGPPAGDLAWCDASALAIAGHLL